MLTSDVWRTTKRMWFPVYLNLLKQVRRELRPYDYDLVLIPGTAPTTNNDFKPSRRVRTVPGGPQSFTLGDGSDEPFEIPSKVLTYRFLCKQ